MFYDRFIQLCVERDVAPSAVVAQLHLAPSLATSWKHGAVPRSTTLRKIADYFGVPVESLTADDAPAKEEGNATFLGRDDVRMIPLYESVSAGFGAAATDSVVGYVPNYGSTEADALAIRVSGDSMYPKIENGDVVVVHKQESVDSGSLAVVILDGDEGFVKRVEYGPDWIVLYSINPLYPPQKYKGEEVTRLRVVGKVVRIIKEV